MSDRQVTVSFKYEVAAGGGGRDPIAYLERLKRLQEEVAAGSSRVGRYGTQTGSPTPSSSTQTQAPGDTPGLQSGLHTLSREIFFLRVSVDTLNRRISRIGSARTTPAADEENPLIRLGIGRGRGFGDMGSGLGGGFGRMRIARAVLSPTSAAGMAGMMGLGPVGLAAGIGVGSAVMAGRTASWAGSLTDTANRNDISEGTRERMMSEANPIVGGLRKWWREDVLEPLTGVTDAIRRSNNLAEKREAQRSFWFGQMSQVSALRMQEAGAENMANAMGGARAIPYQQFNRQSFLGERAYQEQNILLPLQERAAQSGRVAEARRADLQSALGEHRRIVEQEGDYRNSLAARRNRLRQIEGRTGSQLAMIQNRGDEVSQRNLVIQTERDLLAIIKNREASERRVREYRVASAQASSQERRDQAAILQGQLQNLRARRDERASAATRFGAVGMVGREMQEAAVEQFFRHGPGGVTQETIELALQSPAAREVELRLQRFGEGTGNFQRIRRMAGDNESVASMDARENEMQNRMAGMLVEDQQRLANELSGAFRGAANLMLDALRDVYKYMGDQITDIQRRRNT